MQQIGRNGASQQKKTTIGTVGESNSIRKKTRTQKKSQRGPTQGPQATEQAPGGPTGQVSAEEVQMEAQDVTMDEEVEKDTDMDTQMPEASEQPEAQRKRTGEQESGTRKKEKAHRKQMETSLTTDDVEMIAMTVEDRLSEVWENVENHRASILEQVQEVKTVLEQLRIKVEQQQKEKPMPVREGAPVGETVQITMQGSDNFIITPDMLFIDEETMQKPMKDIEMLDLALPKIPTKALYKLQVSVMQEIQSRARSDATNLQIAQEENMVLKEAISQEGKKKEIAQQKVDEMETQINTVFQAISDDTVSEEASSEEKITKIAQTLQQYKEKIKELEEHAVPMTPPAV
jgi:hypothetical protein